MSQPANIENYVSEVPKISQLSALIDHTAEAQSLVPAPVSTGDGLLETRAEAARYAVLRRLAPALKHDMVVDLQAVSMLAEVLSAKLEKGIPSPAEFQKSVSRINRLARDAVATCLKVTAWIEPAADDRVRLHDGVADCVTLLQSSFNFQGFSIRNEVAESDFEVSRVVLRNLLAACLIMLTDTAPTPCEVSISAEIESGLAAVTIHRKPRTDDGEYLSDDARYRALEWADVQALADAESIELLRGDDHLVMRFPRLVVITPLQIAAL